MKKMLYSNYLKGYKCKYYITKSVKTFSNGQDRVPSYGVRIEKLLCKNKKESVEISHIGINELDVKVYLKKLYDSSATPDYLKRLLTTV